MNELGAKGRHTLLSLQRLKERREVQANKDAEGTNPEGKRGRKGDLNSLRASLVSKKKVCICYLIAVTVGVVERGAEGNQ